MRKRSYESVRAVIHEWQHSGRALRAFRKRTVDGGGVVYTAPAEPPPEETSQSTTRLWALADMSRWRAEQVGEYGSGGVETLSVRDREWSWTWTSYSGAFSNKGDPNSAHALPAREWFFDPSPLLATESLEPLRETMVAGRPSVSVRAEPRRPSPHRLHFGILEGDEHELCIDLERGIVLRDVGYVDGERYQETEIVEIAFDERFDEDVFRFEPPDGQPIKTPEEVFAPPQTTTLDVAAREAPFTVLVPGRIPEDAAMEGMLIPARPPVQPTSVHISYRRRDGRAWVSISEQADADELLSGEHWESTEMRGRKLFHRSMGDQEQIGLKRDGTWITLVGTGLSREDLFEIALSLKPAPTDPPRLMDA